MTDFTMNKLANVHNRYQGDYKRVLFLCSAGLLRSATAASVFSSPPFNWNTRNAGVTKEYALIDVSLPLLEWAQEIYLMEPAHLKAVIEYCNEAGLDEHEVKRYVTKCRVLDVQDNYRYRDPALVKELKAAMKLVSVIPLKKTVKHVEKRKSKNG